VLSFINIVLCSWSHGTVPHCHWHLFFQGLQPPPAASSLQNHRDKIGAHSVMSIQYPSQLKRVKGGHWFRATIHRPTCPSFSCDPCARPTTVTSPPIPCCSPRNHGNHRNLHRSAFPLHSSRGGFGLPSRSLSPVTTIMKVPATAATIPRPRT
jgi:hypothetical protein